MKTYSYHGKVGDERDVFLLANGFARRLAESLSADTLREVVERNKTSEYGECCATHDYLDANEVMLTAFITAFSAEPDFLFRDPVFEQSADRVLWNAAWSIVKARGLRTFNESKHNPRPESEHAEAAKYVEFLAR